MSLSLLGRRNRPDAHLSKTTFPDDLQQLERIDRQMLVLIRLESDLNMNTSGPAGNGQPFIH